MPNTRSKTWTTTTPANVADAQHWEDHAVPDGGTTGQVLTKISNTSQDADWADPASSGHVIEDEDDNEMTQRDTLQFLNADVTDDSVNGKTVVDCKGSKGDAATIAVGTVTTLPAGSSATVTNSGTSSAAVFDFGIPKGEDGAGSGDMKASDYDSDSSVKTAGGIASYVAGVLPVITDTYSDESHDGMSGVAVASAISGKADKTELPVEITRTSVTVAAGSDVRIPASGTNSAITTSSTVIPVCDKLDNSNTPAKFSTITVSTGYVTIKMSEALSGATVGIIVFNN